MNRRPLALAAAAAGATVLLALAAPLAASAHVHVTPDQATPGSTATLTFRMPNESATATTTKLEVDLPTDTPFTSVSYQPVAGWTTQITTGTLPKPIVNGNDTITQAPVSVTWTAQPGSELTAGQFQLFTVSVGPVPDTGSILLPAHQTYSDGSVVDWADVTPASGVEPAHPAPTLYVNDAPPVDADAPGGVGTVSPANPQGPATPSAAAAAGAPQGGSGGSASGGSGGTGGSDAISVAALGLGIGGLGLGLVALVFAVLGYVRHPRAARAAAPAVAVAGGGEPTAQKDAE
jgi:uncharacterized protein YcnI